MQQDQESLTEGKKCAANDEAQPEDKTRKGLDEITEVHSKALDDLVNVNSLFTMAVFIGLSFTNPKQHNLENKPACYPEPVMAKRMIMYEVLSFGFFLISSLAAKSLKVLLNFRKIEHQLKLVHKSLHLFLSHNWRQSLLFVSFSASVGGIISLMLSMLNLIQIRLGKMYCGSVYAERSITSLIAMVCISLIALYLPPFLIAMFAELKKETNDKKPGSENAGTGGV